MDSIILTIRKTGCFHYDFEIPTNQKVGDIIDDIINSLLGMNPDLVFDFGNCSLLNIRTGKVLDKDKTIAEEKVWNGDIVDII